MFYAICSSTNEKVNSLTIEENPRYQFLKEEVFYADPDEIESCPKEIDITKIKVMFRKGKEDVINWNGTQYDMSPCFYIPNKEKLGINTVPESKEHKLAKDFIYDKIKKKELLISYSQINKPYKYKNTINVFELPIDYEKVGIETTSSKIGGLSSRRADIIMPFVVKHPVLGNGVVIEIQFSKQYKRSKVSRELDWAIRGYSVAWLYEKDFEIIEDKHISLKEIVRVDSFANLIKENNKSFVRNLKFEVQNLIRQLDYEKEIHIQSMREYEFKIKSIVEEESKKFTNYIEDVKTVIRDKQIENIDLDIDSIAKEIEKKLRKNIQPICPFCKIYAKLIDYNNSKFWGCSNYPACNWTTAYTE